MTESTAVATVQPQQPKTAVPLLGQLSDLDQAWRLAQALSLADILPKDLRGKPSNVLLTILYGQQLNVPPVIAIQTISVVKGRPQMAGKLLLAKVREAGHRAEISEHTDTSCTVTITRGDTGETHSETFTLDNAVSANLVKIKDGKPYARSQGAGEPLPWESWTRRMLLWRAAGFCADFICPEVRMGFAIEGEMDTLPDERPSLAQVAAERADKPAEPVKDDASVQAEVERLAAEFAPTADAVPVPEDEIPAQTISRPQVERVRELLGTCGVDSVAERANVLGELVGHPVTSIAALTRPEGVHVVAELEMCGEKDDPVTALGELRNDIVAGMES